MSFLLTIWSWILSLVCLIFGHSFLPATCETPAICTLCGVTSGEVAEHNYENGYCSYCGIEDEYEDNMTPEETEIFVTELSDSIEHQKDALNCLSKYTNTGDEFYKETFYRYIDLAKYDIYIAQKLSSKFSNMEIVDKELKASYNILEQIENGSYDILTLIDMIDDSITHIGNAVQAYKAII